MQCPYFATSPTPQEQSGCRKSSRDVASGEHPKAGLKSCGAATNAEESPAPTEEEERSVVNHVSIDLQLDTWSTPNGPRSWSTVADSEGNIITVIRAPGVPSSPRSAVSLEEFWGIALKLEDD